MRYLLALLVLLMLTCGSPTEPTINPEILGLSATVVTIATGWEITATMSIQGQGECSCYAMINGNYFYADWGTRIQIWESDSKGILTWSINIPSGWAYSGQSFYLFGEHCSDNETCEGVLP